MSRRTITRLMRTFDPKGVRNTEVIPATERRYFQVHPALRPTLLAPNQAINVVKEARRQGLSDKQIKKLGIK